MEFELYYQPAIDSEEMERMRLAWMEEETAEIDHSALEVDDLPELPARAEYEAEMDALLARF